MHVTFAKSELNQLITTLERLGYQVLGPTLDEAAIVYREVRSLADLPQGFHDVQAPGTYRVNSAGHSNYFEFNLGPQSWKQFLFPAQAIVATAALNDNRWEFETPQTVPPRFAFLGVRACELAAIAIQDRIFLHGPYVDPIYQARRESVFIVAVNCTVAAATCFCTSMHTGPVCKHGFDLALTELENCFVVDVGSQRGEQAMENLATIEVTQAEVEQAQALQRRAAEQISKRMDTTDIRNVIMGNMEHPHWDEVAQRCLSCTNCTMVCPTCFCSSVAEVADLSGERIERQRQWDSCFNVDFSYTASGTVRDNRRSRFRQWLSHKLASWHDQFDSSGCVGCGRCITWCPVGIDLTEAVAALRLSPGGKRQLPIVEQASSNLDGRVCRVQPGSDEVGAQ